MIMDIVSFVNKTLGIFTIGADVFIFAVIIFFLFGKKDNPLFKFLSKQGIVLAFVVALFSTSSSLFYSQIAGFAPCNLCWLQRIFMYPQVLLLTLVLFKKSHDDNLVNWALVLSSLGFLVSIYHNFIYYSNGGLKLICQFVNTGAPCVKRYVFEFGFVTIPSMALTAFALIIIFLVFYKLKSKL